DGPTIVANELLSVRPHTPWCEHVLERSHHISFSDPTLRKLVKAQLLHIAKTGLQGEYGKKERNLALARYMSMAGMDEAAEHLLELFNKQDPDLDYTALTQTLHV